MHTSDDLAVLESARTRARLRIIIGRGEMSFGVAEQSRGPPQLRKFYSTVLNVYAESVDCARARSVGTPTGKTCPDEVITLPNHSERA